MGTRPIDGGICGVICEYSLDLRVLYMNLTQFLHPVIESEQELRLKDYYKYKTWITIFINLRFSPVSNKYMDHNVQHGLMFRSSYQNHLDMSS